MIQARFEGTSTLATSFASQTLGITPQSGYAIIVSGKQSDNKQLAEHTASVNLIYDTLIQKRGFLADNVKLLKSTTSAAVTKQQIQDAITVWAKAKLSTDPGPLYIFLIDHGSTSGFILDNETLTPPELATWLDTLESDPTVAAGLGSYNRFIIIGTCYSGIYIEKLSKAGRIIITSATAQERSLSGADIYNSSSNTTVSGGEYFIDSMITFLGRGSTFTEAFTEARSNVGLRDDRKIEPGTHAEVFDSLAQHPLLDDSGDKKGSYLLGANGDRAATLNLGVGVRTLGNPADITSVTETTIIPANQNYATPLWLKVNDNSRIAEAWMEIRTPVTTTIPTPGTAQYTPELQKRPLYFDGMQWQKSDYTFTQPGTYNILYYTQDNQTNDVSPVKHTVVYKQTANSTPPGTFYLSTPANNSGITPPFKLTWGEVSSPNDITYTLLVYSPDGTEIYKQEQIPQAGAYLTETMLKDKTGAYYCSSKTYKYCFWKVKAVDNFGATSESNTRTFTIVEENALPAILTGYIRNFITGVPIQGATVGAGTASTTTYANGAYLISVPAGSTNLNITAQNYQSTTIPLSATSGKVLTTNVNLKTTGGSTKPGDCDNSGTVTIAEVQSAINMFLGLNTVAACVDQDSSNSVSIAEVQKVINSFLGL